MERLRGCFLCGRPTPRMFCDLHAWQDKKNSCNICGKCFKQPNQLEFHKKFHGTCDTPNGGGEHSYSLAHVDWPFLCEMCGKVFLLSKGLINHQLKGHSRTSLASKKKKRNVNASTKDIPPVHTCCLCSKSFTEKSDLIQHFQEVHVAENPWQCSVCYKAFAQQDVLQRHWAAHAKERVFACTFCERKFKLKHHLKEHVRIHTKERRFHCAECNKSFVHRNTFENHCKNCNRSQAITQDDQPFSHIEENHKEASVQEKHFVCEICGKGFISNGNLMEHQVSHTDERPYVCDLCGRTFKRHQTLMRHRRQKVQPSTLREAAELSDVAEEPSDKAPEFLNDAAEFSDDAGAFDGAEAFNEAIDSYEDQVFQDNSRGMAKSIQTNEDGHIDPQSTKEQHNVECPDTAKMTSYIHICCSCKKEFTQKDELIQHYQDVHVAEKPWMCKECQKTFAQQEDLERHMVAHEKERAFACNLCGKKFRQKHHLKEHSRIHTQEKRFHCELCNKTFLHRNTFNIHKKKCIPTGPNTQGELASYVTDDAFSLDPQAPHLTSHDGSAVNPKESAASRKEDQEYYFLDKNWSVNDAEVPRCRLRLVCEICNKSFNTRYDFRTHVQSHSDHRPYACDICGKSFKTEKSFKRHKRQTLRPNMSMPAELSTEAANQVYHNNTAGSSHGEKLQTFLQKENTALDILGQVWYATEVLNNSQTSQVTSEKVVGSKNITTVQRAAAKPNRTHANKPKFQCDLCKKLFATQTAMIIHRRFVHTKEKPFSCLKCGRKFALKCHVRKHLKWHAKPPRQPVKCDNCGKSFSSKAVLTRHNREVKCSIDPQELVCNVCGKAFKYKSYLDQHLTVHFDARPFPCDVCKGIFKTKKQLRSHMLSHSEQRRFLCDLCGDTFKSKYSLQCHSGSVHTQRVLEEDNSKTSKPDRRMQLRVMSYECKICKKIFASRNTYSHHLNSQHSHKLLTCETCGKFFGREHVLVEHQREHTQRKEFACNICGQAFWLEKNLAHHKEKGNCKQFCS